MALKLLMRIKEATIRYFIHYQVKSSKMPLKVPVMYIMVSNNVHPYYETVFKSFGHVLKAFFEKKSFSVNKAWQTFLPPFPWFRHWLPQELAHSKYIMYILLLFQKKAPWLLTLIMLYNHTQAQPKTEQHFLKVVKVI